MGVSGVPLYLADLAVDRCRSGQQARGIIYRALFRAAQRGAPCPTQEVMAELCGLEPHSTSHHVRQLELRGMIRVARFQRSRRVTIVATGKSTMQSRETRPHWRERSIQPQPA